MAGGTFDAIRGRGTHSNRAGRFERLQFEIDPEAVDADALEDDDAGVPRTQYYRDRTASVIATNDSPDVGFSASINPYRGCEHGCSYCMSPDTAVLMADGRSKELGSLQVGDAIIGTERDGHYRRFVATTVLDHWLTSRPAYRVSLADGTELVASGDHRFLTHRGWKHVTGSEQGAMRRPHLRPADTLLGPSEDRLVTSIEHFSDMMPLCDITTGTGDFIANGVISHNCYARPYHEYLGLSAGLDFESKIFVKQDAPELLRRELAAPSWKPQTLGLSGVTDAYQPIERHLKITRGCVEVLAECRNPVTVVTKNALVARDADLYAELARHDAARVVLSVTTLDRDLARRLEPRASSPPDRLAAMSTLANAGVPVGAMVAPVIPGLTDHEIPAIVQAVADAGGQFASFTILRLPLAVADLFAEWLEDHEPLKKEKVLARVRQMRGGRLNDSDFGKRMRGDGPMADHIRDLFATSVRRAGLGQVGPLSAASFRRPIATDQPRLFDLG